VLGEVFETFKSVLLLHEEVKRLGNNTSKLAERLDAMHTSVTRLEAHQSDAIRLAEQAARICVSQDMNDIRERLYKIEVYLRSATNPIIPNVLISPPPHSELKPVENPPGDSFRDEPTP
jgi:hypothetical protein